MSHASTYLSLNRDWPLHPQYYKLEYQVDLANHSKFYCLLNFDPALNKYSTVTAILSKHPSFHVDDVQLPARD